MKTHDQKGRNIYKWNFLYIYFINVIYYLDNKRRNSYFVIIKNTINGCGTHVVYFVFGDLFEYIKLIYEHLILNESKENINLDGIRAQTLIIFPKELTQH